MLVKGIDMVLVMVSDFERSLRWYQEVLELPLRARHGDFAYLETGGVPLALHGGRGANEGEGSAASALPVLLVGDYAAAKATLEERGATFTFENTTPAARFGTFQDPDGNGLQILERVR